MQRHNTLLGSENAFERTSLFWKQGAPYRWLRAARGLGEGGAGQSANIPGKAGRGQLTVSLKQHSHTKYEKLATNGGAIGAPWALWGGLGWTTGRLDPLPDSVARGQNMSDIHTRVTLHGNYSPQIPKPTVA